MTYENLEFLLLSEVFIAPQEVLQFTHMMGLSFHQGLRAVSDPSVWSVVHWGL